MSTNLEVSHASEQKVVDVLIPCHNEESSVELLIERIFSHSSEQISFRIIIVDDGSVDRTYSIATSIAETDERVFVIRFSRNFGKEAAMAAGLSHSEGDALIMMDADLQHPPDVIPELIRVWLDGSQIVDAVKAKRQRESLLKKWAALGFNHLIGTLTDMDFAGASDYKLLDKQIVKQINSFPERTRFFRGLVSWVGYRHSAIEFEVRERQLGVSKFNWRALISLSVDAVVSHTSKPLYVSTFLGCLCLVFSFLIGVQTLFNRLSGNAVDGFTTVILVVLILSSMILINLGIIGLYLAKIYNEVKARPIYIIAETSADKCRTLED